jgi:hypothetical protein
MPNWTAPALHIPLALLLCLAVVAGTVTALLVLRETAAPAAAAQQESLHYELAARVNLPHGFIREAAWLDNDNYLALMLSPDGAAVWRIGYSTPDRQKFMSSTFIEENICPAGIASRLTWTVSPGRKYVCFLWFLDDGSRKCALIDISHAPEFRIKHFTPPAGMQVAKALFSPDDRYIVLAHDAFHEGCEVSLLVLDLEQGAEVWRISTHELSFISELWWGGAILDEPRFSAAAGLSDGQFHERPGQAVCDIRAHQLTYTSAPDGLLGGAESLWGQVACYSAAPGAATAFYMRPTVPGHPELTEIPLSAKPVQVEMTPVPGLVLLSNTLDYITNELWTVNVLTGGKSLVDEDCASFSLASDNKLLVRSQTKSELRIYELLQPQ